MTKYAKLYLAKIKQDRFKIKFLVGCFPAYTTKWPRDKSTIPHNVFMKKTVSMYASERC